MKRFAPALALAAFCVGVLLALAVSAQRCHAPGLLPPTTITAAISPAAVGSVLEYRDDSARGLTIQCNFVYGSGGASADAYVQTSVDGGSTWVDVAQFHFTTSSGIRAFNLSSLTPITTQATPTDGTLAANTAVDGIVGPLIRIKYQSSGTYGGNTSLSIDVSSTRLGPR